MEDYFTANIPQDLVKIAVTSGVVFGDAKTSSGSGEFCAGYGNIILKKGFKGIKEEAEEQLSALNPHDIHTHDKRRFYEAAIICCDGVKLLGERHAAKARELADVEIDEVRKAELLNIAKVCDRVPYNPPETFQEAIQTVWFTEIALFTEENTQAFCIDRPDQYLYPFYKQDKMGGILTDKQAQELLECLWIKMAEIIYNVSEGAAMIFSGYQPYHGMTIGGCTKDGNDASNELSFMALQASMDTRMHVPTVNVRVNEKTSDEFLMKVCALVEVGTGQPAIFFDETAWKILRRNGVEDEDLWNWSVAGCVEPQIPGKTHMWDEGGRFSYATAVEWALWNGVSKIVGPERLGLETGDPRSFKTYEEKSLTMEQLLEALDKDFQGYEDVRQMLINGAPKYGNDDSYVDDIASKFISLSCGMCGEYTSIFGSKYVNGLVPVIANIPHGEVITALPSGRKATLPLSDGISPFPGYDKNGPSAVLKSACAIDHTKNGCGTLLNMKLTPALIASDEDKRKLIALLRAESKLGGYHIQFNVVKKETLLHALDKPEDYQDLLVRVAGYSAYFVELRKEAQNLIIDRTENAAW